MNVDFKNINVKQNVILKSSLIVHAIICNKPAQLIRAAGRAEITIPKNGYLFVFVSNEMERMRNSSNPLKNNKQAFGESQGSVYFDDLSVTHTPGPLLEACPDEGGKHHYYPTGLEMFALSSSAGNGHVRNRYGYQGQERENTFALNLNEFEARHYDGQIGRWMVPDPANQFPSPYVGMGNQWVSTIDPDGRIAFVAVLGIAVVTGGYAGASIQSGNWNPAKWDNDWYNGALKGAMLATSIATGGVGSGLLGTKAATSFGAFKAAKTAKILANTMSGLINMTNYHDPDVGFGLHSIARFAAGYFGSAVGTTEGGDVVGGMFVGGVLNAGVSAAFEKGINEYGLAQAFVGGALASMSGHSFYKSTSTAWGLGGSESKYLINKYYDKMLTYGFQNLANNFAFDDEQKFFNKHWTTHFASFTVGAAGGQMQYEVMNNSVINRIDNFPLRFFTRLTLSSGFYIGEYMLNYRAKTDGIYVNWSDFSRFKSNSNLLKTFFYSFSNY
jgi:RHS repeat-associated protein